MRRLSILLFCLALSFLFIGCPDDYTAKELRPNKYNYQGQECANVYCYVSGGDTVCYKNPGTPSAKKLPKSSVCYDVLVETAPSTPPPVSNPPPDNKSPTFQVNFEFIDSMQAMSGFDAAFGADIISSFYSEKRASFFSVKKNGKLKVLAKISQAQRNLFSDFYINLGGADISFDSTVTRDSIEIFKNGSLADTICFYGRYKSIIPTAISISGVNRSGEIKKIICDDNTCDESILALCYEERIIDSLRLFRINNPLFSQPDTTIKNTFNKILKQAVVRVNGVITQNYTETNWDKNGNGKLDLFPSKDSVPSLWFEQDSLRAQVETIYNNCLSCASADSAHQPAKVFIMPSTINGNWILMDSVSAGSDSIIIQYSRELAEDNGQVWRNVSYKLRKWDGTNSEIFQINTAKIPAYGKTRNRIIIKFYNYKLKNNHFPHEVMVHEQYVLGFAYGNMSCSWVNSNMNTRDILHEILHMRNTGRLQHTTFDTLNIMYPFTKPYSQLRYRDVILEEFQEISNKQWEALNKRVSY